MSLKRRFIHVHKFLKIYEKNTTFWHKSRNQPFSAHFDSYVIFLQFFPSIFAIHILQPYDIIIIHSYLQQHGSLCIACSNDPIFIISFACVVRFFCIGSSTDLLSCSCFFTLTFPTLDKQSIMYLYQFQEIIN